MPQIICLDYCNDDPLGTHEVVSCATDPVGGASAMVVLECNHQLTDPSSGAEVLAEIAAGRAHLVERVSVTFDAPAEVTQDSLVPCETPRLVTYDRTGTYVNPNVSATNIDFHDKLMDGRKFGGLIVYECGTDDPTETKYVSWVNTPVKFTGGRILPGVNTEFQRFEGKITWRQKVNPSRHVMPEGVFFQS